MVKANKKGRKIAESEIRVKELWAVFVIPVILCTFYMSANNSPTLLHKISQFVGIFSAGLIPIFLASKNKLEVFSYGLNVTEVELFKGERFIKYNDIDTIGVSRNIFDILTLSHTIVIRTIDEEVYKVRCVGNASDIMSEIRDSMSLVCDID